MGNVDLTQTTSPAETYAVEYVRMSTEHQQYSTENQRDAIRQYAKSRGMVITRSYVDAGKSGLRIEGRTALKQLLRDVESRQADFSVILVYDVSRWGRFQDTDESAYYEYICRRANIKVHYCAEPFENDGSPISTIVKSVKRAMAAEYSRELSNKVFVGMCRLIELGYRQGGAAGIGLRRMLVGANGAPKGLLTRGEQKSIDTDRVILVPGPPEEVEIVRSIFRMYVEENRYKTHISKILNDSGAKTEWGHRWNHVIVHDVLTSEKYMGSNVYYKTSFRLKARFVRNPPDMWINKPGAFEPIISPDLFYKAQAVMAERARRMTDEELLDYLRKLLEREGRLSGPLIDKTEGMPCTWVYVYRFKSLVNAFKLIGYIPRKDYGYIEVDQELERTKSTIVSQIIEQILHSGGSVTREPATDLLMINNEFTASVVVARCRRRPRQQTNYWFIPVRARLKAEITIIIRMDQENREPLDYYFLPRIEIADKNITLREHNSSCFDTYRFSSLDFFFRMIKRVRASEAV
jgi:DNA invertase Pin-like site-specific DNA recombinase